MWKASFLKSVDWQFVIPAYCLLSLKQLCVASHNCFYDKYIIMQSSVAWKDANIINSSVVCISPCQTARIYDCCTISKCIIDMTGGVLEEERRMLSKAGLGDLANEVSKVWESRRWVSLISRVDKSSDCGLHRCERLWLWVFWRRPWSERMVSYMVPTYTFESCRFQLLIVEYTAGKILFLIARLSKVYRINQSIGLSIYLRKLVFQ